MPADPLRPRRPDEHFAAEAAAAGEHRPPRLPDRLRRVRDPVLQLHHHTAGITGRGAGIPAHAVALRWPPGDQSTSPA